MAGKDGKENNPADWSCIIGAFVFRPSLCRQKIHNQKKNTRQIYIWYTPVRCTIEK
jgi:hypothetical protein